MEEGRNPNRTRRKKKRSKTFDDTIHSNSSRSPKDPRSPRDALQIDEQQKLKNKKQRYIEYGSDDDSDKSQQIFQKTPRTRPRPKSAIIRKQEVSSSDDEPIGKRKK